MNDKPTLQELLEVQEYFGLPGPALVEKDWHVVKALAAIAAVDTGEFRLVFGGGTALSRAHRLTKRMSEDVDLKIVSEKNPSRGALRKLRGDITDALLAAGFVFDPDTLLLVVLLIHTGSRVTALLELTTEQIDLTTGIIDLNPAGREETDKRRAVLPIPATLSAWLVDLPKGHLIQYRGSPIAERDTAFNAAVRRSKIGTKANTYSARHSLGRRFREARIDTEETGVWLANGRIDEGDEVTLVYSPWAPGYLNNCRRAVEDFVREINTHTRKWDLAKPYAVKADWKGD